MRSLLRWSSAVLILSTFSGQAAPAQQRSQFQLFDKKSSKGAEIAPMAGDAKVNHLAPSPSLRLFAEIGQAKLPSSFRQQQPYPELMHLGAKIPASTWPGKRVWEELTLWAPASDKVALPPAEPTAKPSVLSPKGLEGLRFQDTRANREMGSPWGSFKASARQNFQGGAFKP